MVERSEGMTEQHEVPLAGERHRSSESIEVRNPYDGSTVGLVPKCTADDVDRAVRAAADRLRREPLPPWRRAEILDRAATLLAERRDDFARTIAVEAAKPIKTARIEATRAVSTFQFSAAVARSLTGEMVPIDASEVGEGKLGFVLRVPVGVIGAISPFNFPLNLVAHKLAPAIAAGCPVVLKPASQTPFSGIALAELLLDECGLPPGWLSVVTGGGGDIGNAIVDHPDVALITFTGAPRKRVGLELGNNAPVIIEPSADWKTAASKIKVAGFSHAGQSCISTQRVYVQRSIHDDFVSALAQEVSTLVVGDPLDEATDVSSLISRDDTERVSSWIEEAVAQGAHVDVGGKVHGRLLEPTVLTGVLPDMKVCTEEVFGPVVGIAAYDDIDEALQLANDTRYGLQAAIFTNELDVALRAARALDFGGVLVNEVPTWRTDQMPYGGLRDSGNTREGPKYAVREMTEERLIVVQA
jgi:acyl-CoA reductase-like NAD-dependent aldehyde dehydrogenase